MKNKTSNHQPRGVGGLKHALGVLLLCAASAQASTHTFDFNSDPVAAGVFKLYGNSQWYSTGGAGAATNANDGFLEVTAAANSQRSVVVFPNFDGGSVVQGFTFEADFRIGNGTTTPADGFSVNYVRSNDPVLSVVAAGGDPSSAGTDPNPPAGAAWVGHGVFATGPNNEDNLPEEGTWTGISIGFDAWNSGGSSPYGYEVDQSIGPDIVGMDIRLDGILISQVPMTTLNGAVTDPTSIQTGPNDGSYTAAPLGWAHLKVDLNPTNGLLNVWWKGTQIMNNYSTGFLPSPGTLVFAGRTGGANEIHDVDNIVITTVPANNVVVGTTTGIADGVKVTFFDSGQGVVNTGAGATVSIDGGTAVPATTVTKVNGTTTVTYYGFPTLLTAGSQHTVVATVTDGFGRKVSSSSASFTVQPYSVVNSSSAVTGVDTSTVGFRMRTWQSGTEPNDIWWAWEQLNGLQGANLADTSSFTDNGYLDYTAATAFSGTAVINMDYGGNADGNFTINNGYIDNAFPGLVQGANGYNNIDNTAMEVLGFLYFPASGVYTMGVNSDDGFTVTVGSNPQDWGSLLLGYFNGGRGASDTTFSFVIPQSGYYPFRLEWENGGGGANCEWFMVKDGTRILVNDPSPTNNTGVVAYYGGPALPAYVSDEFPYPNESSPLANSLRAMITDLGTTVTDGSLSLALDGTTLANPQVSKSGGVTTITPAANYLMPLGKHTAQLVYRTSGGGPFTNAWTFTITSYLPPSWAVTGVDTSRTGFQIKPYQTAWYPNVATQPNTVRWTLEQLAGLHGPNGADLTQATDGGFIDYTVAPDGSGPVINFNLDPNAGSQGDFNVSNGYQDQPFPGLVFSGAINAPAGAKFISDIGDESLDVRMFLGFANAGVYTFGVNSDDGFAVYGGTNPADWFSAELLGSFNGGRGASDTTFSVYVAQAGIYAIRLVWENGNGSFSGGNAANCEFFVVQPDGTKILVNDPLAPEATGVTAYFSGPTLPAYVSAFTPANGATGVFPIPVAGGLNTSAFGVQLTDGSTTVTPASIAVYINGTAVTPVVSQTATAPKVTTVTLPITSPLPTGAVTAQLVYSTSGSGPITNTWSFTVGNATAPIANPAWAVTGVDTTKPGFMVRPYKSSGDVNAGQPNDVLTWTEYQMAGAHGANLADMTLATDNGYIDIPTTDASSLINWNNQGQAGNFQSGNGYTDNYFPGSGGQSTWDNSAEEVLCYINFPQAGIYQMGVNSDDGFSVKMGSNPRDWTTSIVIGDFQGGRGSSDTLFYFVVPAPGYYPVRMLWQNGGGGFNCEWFMVEPDGTKLLINDPNAPVTTGLRAYYKGPALPAFISEIEPVAGSTGDAAGLVGVTLQNGSTTVIPGSITLLLNGTAVGTTITTVNGVTKVGLANALPYTGTFNAMFIYSTSGGGPYTNTWTFTVSDTASGIVTLSTNLWTPTGSGLVSGFAMRAYQCEGNGYIFNGWYNLTRYADLGLWGLFGTNMVDTTQYTNNGEMWWSGIINFAQNADGTLANNGEFQGNDGYPDVAVPGLAGAGGLAVNGAGNQMNYDGYQARFFLEFPKAGPYVFGVDSDDCMLLMEGDQGSPGHSCLSVLSPASAAGDLSAIYTTTGDNGGNNGFGVTPSKTTPIIAKAVLCNPVNCTSIGSLLNASAISNNVAVFIHNGNFQTQARMAYAAGAIAVVCGQLPTDAPLPGTRGAAGGGTDPAIPCIETSYAAFTDLTNSITMDTTSPVLVRISAHDCSPLIGGFENAGGRGSSDTLFTVQVPQAGIYPFRMLWENGTGGANSEFFVVDDVTGSTIPVNDPTSPVKAWITRNVNAPGGLGAPKLNKPYVDANGNIVVSWTGLGELWEAYSATGPWFKSTYQANPSAVVQNPYLKERFFRVRMY